MVTTLLRGYIGLSAESTQIFTISPLLLNTSVTTHWQFNWNIRVFPFYLLLGWIRPCNCVFVWFCRNVHACAGFAYLSTVPGNQQITGEICFQTLNLVLSSVTLHVKWKWLCLKANSHFCCRLLSLWKWAWWARVVFNLSYISCILGTLALWLWFAHENHCPTALQPGNLCFDCVCVQPIVIQSFFWL